MGDAEIRLCQGEFLVVADAFSLALSTSRLAGTAWEEGLARKGNVSAGVVENKWAGGYLGACAFDSPCPWSDSGTRKKKRHVILIRGESAIAPAAQRWARNLRVERFAATRLANKLTAKEGRQAALF